MDTNKIQDLFKMKQISIDMQNTYKTSVINVGDYTYGIPKIMQWDEKTKLTIGKFCSIAEDVVIVLGGEHRIDWVSTYPFNALLDSFNYIDGHPSTKGDILIGNDVWIGSGVKILSGVTVGNGAVIGANTVVSTNVPAYAVVAGNPMNIIRYRFEPNVICFLENFKWWDKSEEEIIEIIPLLQSNNIEALKKKEVM